MACKTNIRIYQKLFWWWWMMMMMMMMMMTIITVIISKPHIRQSSHGQKPINKVAFFYWHQGTISKTDLIAITLAEAPDVAYLRQDSYGAYTCQGHSLGTGCTLVRKILWAWPDPSKQSKWSWFHLVASPSFRNLRLWLSANGISLAPRQESSNMEP